MAPRAASCHIPVFVEWKIHCLTSLTLCLAMLNWPVRARFISGVNFLSFEDWLKDQEHSETIGLVSGTKDHKLGTLRQQKFILSLFSDIRLQVWYQGVSKTTLLLKLLGENLPHALVMAAGSPWHSLAYRHITLISACISLCDFISLCPNFLLPQRH